MYRRLRKIRNLLHKHKREVIKWFTQGQREAIKGFTALVHPSIYEIMEWRDIRICKGCDEWHKVKHEDSKD